MMSVLSQAWQSWRAAKGVAAVAVVALAVGIGSATAIFTIINGVMLQPLPYPEGDRYITLFGARENEPGRYGSSTFPDLLEYQRQTTSFDVFGWFRLNSFNLISSGEPQYVAGAAVTPSLAHNLGVSPRLGRWFTDETGVVLSHALWTRMGSRADIVGTAVTLDGRPLTITGVMPKGFRLPVASTVAPGVASDVWIYLDPLGKGENPTQGIYFAYGRRKPGVSLAQAQADAKRAAAEIARRDPSNHPLYTSEVVDLRETTFRELRATLFLLFAAAGLLLLISCANVATLLLVRSVARSRDTAIRLALGASRGHLALRFLVEAGIVSVAGAAAGVALSAPLVRLLLTVGSEYVPYAEEIAIDWKVLAFGLAMALVSSGLAGLAPLWQATRTAPNAVLTEGVRASAGARARRLSQALVVSEIALAFALLAVSAILIAHLRELSRTPTGFNPEGLLTFSLTLPQRAAAATSGSQGQRRLVEAVRAIPGVRNVTFANQLPLAGCCMGGTLFVESQPAGNDARRVSFMFTTPEYISTVGVPLRAGRFLTEADAPSNGVLNVVVNQTAAARYWPNRDPIGASGRLNRPDGNPFSVVGVVGDVQNDGLNAASEAEMYMLASIVPLNPMNVLVRSPLPTAQLLTEIRRAIAQIDPTLAIHDVQMMDEVVSGSLQLERMSSVTMTFFAMAALLMATLGIYGVVSYAVRQRTVEMGTRMALGAVGRDLLTLVVGDGLKLAAAGLAVGAIAIVGGVWVLIRLLEVRDIGWAPVMFSTAIVAGIATVASWVPAWRTTLLSPMVAMRDQPASVWQSAQHRLRRAMHSVTQAVTRDEGPATIRTDALAEFVAASRAAGSFADALQMVLSSVCNALTVDSALLLAKNAGDEYRGAVAVGALASSPLVIAADGYLIGRLMAYSQPLPFEAGEFEALAAWADASRPERADEIRRLGDARVRLAVPLRTHRDVIGVLLFAAPSGRDHFTTGEREFLRNCADQFALMLENARLTVRVVEQETLRRDLALAAEIQRGLLPTEPPVADVAEFAALSIPARSIGGDYHDFIQTGDRIGVAVADVSGKGVAAALIMSVMQASLRIFTAESGEPLPRMVARMNRFLFRSTPANKYATFFYAQVDPESRQLRYVNAGHNPPYLIRSAKRPGDADIQELASGGTVVGMFPEMGYEESTVDLCPGDVLLAFTDGVTEAHSPDSVEFGEDKLKAVLGRVAHLPADQICASIAAELKQWIKDAEQYDDLTLVVMKVR
jgi:predicted permease